ncbi:hypothetical protein BVX97_05280 [bacterium E08(2017)]|nr:hypothetical protein BVX97_05280 [bacterium E08(2017)]
MGIISAIVVSLLLAQQVYSSPMHVAVQKKDLAAISKLAAKYGPSAVNKPLENGITPLHIAAANNDKNATAILLSLGADTEAKTESGFTPLHWAANKDSSDAAEILIEMGADVNAQSNKGITPLHWAANHNSSNVVKVLVMAGADIYKTSAKGYRPIHWAVIQEAESVYPMLLFKEASDKESSGEQTTNELRDIQEVDWQAMLNSSEVMSPPPVVLDGLPSLATGSDASITLGHDSEMHFVWLNELDMWFAKYELTNTQYRQFKPNHSSLFREDFNLNGKKQPAVYLSWKQAKIFCTWLNRNHGHYIPKGYTFRLPTEEEWMEAAKCGKQRTYPWGDTLPPAYGNYSDSSLKKVIQDWKGIKNYDDTFVVSCNVDESGVNEWGLYGMAGNVWEWCEDWYDSSSRYKTLRGGSWDYDDESMIRIDSRGFDRPDTRDDTIGIRIVIAPKI